MAALAPSYAAAARQDLLAGRNVAGSVALQIHNETCHLQDPIEVGSGGLQHPLDIPVDVNGLRLNVVADHPALQVDGGDTGQIEHILEAHAVGEPKRLILHHVQRLDDLFSR